MIISRTPLRISFAGGGSDIASYYSYNSGTVVSTAINKYIYITVNKKFDNDIRVSYSKTEIVKNLDQLKHNYIRECLRYVGIKGGIEITSISDIPSEGTGLGSSSSYLVGLLNALYAYMGKHVSADRLAKEACEIEIGILNKRIGKQDQYIAAYGGLQSFDFFGDETVKDMPIICRPKTKEKLEQNLLLFYTGLTRSSDKILKKQSKNIQRLKSIREKMDKMVQLARKMRDDLQDNNIESFGTILQNNWNLKKEMARGITNPQIDRWYKKALKAGATGGKLLGAGGGGFLLFYSDSRNHMKIKKALSDLRPIDFNFEPQGSKIIFVSE